MPLTQSPGPYLRDGDFLLEYRALYIGREEDRELVTGFLKRFIPTGATLQHLDRTELQRRVPGIRPAWSDAVWEPYCADIDVASLHAHFLAQASKQGAILECRVRVTGLERSAGRWKLTTERDEQHYAAVVVNAAGAWADELAVMAGARQAGITPYRRTVAQLRIDPSVPDDLPLVLDIGGRFYFKPESGRIWLSPHDETPSEPCDAAPEEAAIAHAIDRFAHVLGWKVEAVERKWAGLRSFAPDRLPVFGYDEDAPGFFWCAGQGGTGIQTAPAAARLCAQLLLDLPRDAMTEGLDAALYAPDRFGRSRNRGS